MNPKLWSNYNSKHAYDGYFTKDNKLKALGLCDTSNLCGALEFAEKLSKSGSQPIIGTQINFKYNDNIGLLPLRRVQNNNKIVLFVFFKK